MQQAGGERVARPDGVGHRDVFAGHLDDATVGEVLAAARRAHGDRLSEVLERCSVLHAGRYVDDDSTPVTAGATIDVLPPFAGG